MGFLAVSLLMSCSSEGTGQGGSLIKPMPTPASAAPPTIGLIFSYGDGADNRYEFDGSSFTLAFNPVQVGESSSGTYSGGTSWSKVLSQEQSEALIATFTQAIAAKDEQTPERSKGTGIVLGGSGQKAILKMSSPIRKKLEAELQKLGYSL